MFNEWMWEYLINYVNMIWRPLGNLFSSIKQVSEQIKNTSIHVDSEGVNNTNNETERHIWEGKAWFLGQELHYRGRLYVEADEWIKARMSIFRAYPTKTW